MSRKSSLCHCLLTRIRKRANKSNKLPSRSDCEDPDSPAGYIVQAITDAHASLTPLIELTPGEPINSILSRLVGICCEIHPSEVITKVLSNNHVQQILPSLRSMCAEAEYHLESHWAKYIGSSHNEAEAAARLEQFPYLSNYIDLTRMEVAALLAATNTLPRRIAFVGSGPLPLSSLFMLDLIKQWRHTHFVPQLLDGRADEVTTILNIDHSQAAVDVSSLMLSKLRASRETDSGIDVNAHDADTASYGHMSFLCQEASASDLSEFDAVFLAALVGQTQSEKETLLLEIVSKMAPGSILVVRTSWGLRTCLYPEVDLTTEVLALRLKICSVIHPYNDIVNSIIVAQVR